MRATKRWSQVELGGMERTGLRVQLLPLRSI
jgi:hypothetical protein